ncbi:HEPN domain-containing protein [Methylomagnum sp.]
MSDTKHARLMLAMAENDLQALRNMLNPEAFADAIVGFHAQQSVEKLSKAWLSQLGTPYPRTHDLRTLFILIEDAEPAALAPFLPLVDLTDYGVQFRYEAPIDLSPLDRAALLDQVEAFHRQVMTRLEIA